MAARTFPDKQALPPEIRMVSAVPASPKPDAPWTDEYVDGFYGRIAVRQTYGRSLPLVLIHGEASSKTVFRLQMLDALGARHRMIAIDLPGYGASDAGAEPFSLPMAADVVIDTVERLGIERFALLGWSLGGYVALEAAAAALGVAGVMLVGTPLADATVANAWARGNDRPTHNDAGPNVTMCGRQAVNVEPLSRSDIPPRAEGFRDLLAGMTADPHSLASSLGMPLAIVNGANDAITHKDVVALPTDAWLWEHRPHIFPLAGHAPFLDAPELFNATLARFLHHLESEQGVASPSLCLAG